MSGDRTGKFNDLFRLEGQLLAKPLILGRTGFFSARIFSAQFFFSAIFFSTQGREGARKRKAILRKDISAQFFFQRKGARVQGNARRYCARIFQYFNTKVRKAHVLPCVALRPRALALKKNCAEKILALKYPCVEKPFNYHFITSRGTS
ncbi:MAG TPA: hypothetical protein ENJ95_13620 [Bacteroidetes bacterium]|nr:hypothetical protein [Bacteroidota bacterium]